MNDRPLEDLYRDVILDHYRNPRHREPLAAPDATAEGVNPLCGDEVTVEVAMEGDVIRELSVVGQGCSISQSSASMMAEAIVGHTTTEAGDLARRFRAMMTSDAEEDGLGDLAALQGVSRYPVRIKCADLPWTTLDQALAATGGST